MREILKILTDPSSLKALIMPFRTELIRALLIFLGVLIGVFSVYIGIPFLDVQFTSADPAHLTDGHQDTWVKTVAIAYAEGYFSEDDTRSALVEAGYGPEQIDSMIEANEGAPAVVAALQAVRDLPSQDAANDNQISSGILGNLLTLFCLGAYLVGFLLMAVVLSFRPIPIGPWRKQAIAGHESTARMGEAEKQRRAALDAAKEATTSYEEALGEPIATFMSAYVLGDDLYDDSFAIEPGGAFAGECGIGIGETIGVGEPKKVTAMEAWLFDQQEIQTVTYMVMSEHAFNDEALRAKLAPRGEIVLATTDKPIIIETKTLRMQVNITSLEYGEGSLPPNSFFENVTFALAVWQKDGAAETSSAEAEAMPSPQPAQPQPLPSQTPPPQPQPQQPLPSNFAQGTPPPQQQGQPLTGNFGQGAPPPQQPPQQGQPLTGNFGQGAPPPQQPPQQGQPLTGNFGQGAPPPRQQPPPQQTPGQSQPLTSNFGQGAPPQQQGGIRPLTSNAPGGGQGQMPLPRRQPPPMDDEEDSDESFRGRPSPGSPFGDTGEH
ncbi:MAG: hypothetical protein ACLFTK_04210 [Anaerolineales bacterium]